MRISITVRTRIHIPKSEKERRLCALKRKFGCRAILQALQKTPPQPERAEPGAAASKTIAPLGAGG